ncbi:hypothetical protein KJ853_00660 [Patescibacteria group bacterium]|nr:hypothetical protein [Patescibacteria group bacterium]
MSKYGKILLCICLWDLLTTLIWLNLGVIKEGNPLLGFYLENFGLLGFSSGKLFINSLAIFVLELLQQLDYLSKKRKKFYYFLAIRVYLIFYALFTLKINIF